MFIIKFIKFDYKNINFIIIIIKFYNSHYKKFLKIISILLYEFFFCPLIEISN